MGRIERTIGHRTTFVPATESRRFSVAMSDYAMLPAAAAAAAAGGVEAPGITVEAHPFKDQIPRMLGLGRFGCSGDDSRIAWPPPASNSRFTGRPPPLWGAVSRSLSPATHEKVRCQTSPEIIGLGPHCGRLPDQSTVGALHEARASGDEGRAEEQLCDGVREMVREQAERGIDVIGDGEFHKPFFLDPRYYSGRWSGITQVEVGPGERSG